MKTFLETCVDNIFASYGEKLEEICLVLPNRRAGLFIKKHLARKIKQAVFLPDIFSIEDFITELSGSNIIDNISLLFEFFEVHREIEGENAQEFEHFSDWAFPLLRDFNEIDEYLAETDSIFNYLSDSKAIELWDPEKGKLTDFEKKYLHFYRSLNDYYKKLNKVLSEKNLSYQAKAIRNVAENIQSITKKLVWEKTYFIGFNALTKAEEKIITELIRNKKAEVFWDADHYYLNPLPNGIKQEAGYFLNKHFQSRIFSQARWIFDNFKSDKEIKLFGIPKNIGQVKLCGDILQNKIHPDEIDKTAVVLSDESLLIPLINSVPAEIRDFNITMGYGLEKTPLYHLIDNLFTLHKNSLSLQEIRNTKGETYYLKDTLSIFHDPFLQKNASKLSGISDLSEFTKKLLNTNKVLITSDEILDSFAGHKSELLELIFNSWKNSPVKAINSMFKLLDILRKTLDKVNTNTLEIEYLFHFSLVFKRINTIISKYNSIKSIDNLWSVLKQIMRSSSIPFYGEPLKGLQIMGMLETRTLDFDNLILLSANEGILPSSRNQYSFIPFDIKKQFGLPTYKDRDAIFAYHFYRLLQRTKKAYLIYNTEAGDLGGGDISRFLSQIMEELPKYNPNIKIEKKTFSLAVKDLSLKNDIHIEKTPQIMELIRRKASNGLSASSLNTFRTCSLRFYFADLLKLKEQEEIDENLDAAAIGNIVHKSLENLYMDLKGQILKKDFIISLRSKIRGELEKSFKKENPGGDFKFGKNLLIMKASEILVQNVLNNDIESCTSNEVMIKDLEKRIETHFTNSGINEKIKFVGYIDRIDLENGNTLLIDYKTGQIQISDINLKHLDDIFSDKLNDKAFQLLFYAYLFLKANAETKKNVQTAIFALRKKKNALLKLSIEKENIINLDILELFEQKLKELIKQLFNERTEFTQTEDIKNCEYCDFRILCNRQ